MEYRVKTYPPGSLAIQSNDFAPVHDQIHGRPGTIRDPRRMFTAILILLIVTIKMFSLLVAR